MENCPRNGDDVLCSAPKNRTVVALLGEKCPWDPTSKGNLLQSGVRQAIGWRN